MAGGLETRNESAAMAAPEPTATAAAVAGSRGVGAAVWLPAGRDAAPGWPALAVAVAVLVVPLRSLWPSSWLSRLWLAPLSWLPPPFFLFLEKITGSGSYWFWGIEAGEGGMARRRGAAMQNKAEGG